MSTNYHTPWQDDVTLWRASDMNAPVAQLDEAITDLSQPRVHYFGAQLLGRKPAAGIVLMMAVVPRRLALRADGTRCQLSADVAASASAEFTIRKNGSSIGTITVAAGGTTGTVSVPEETDFVAGDLLELVAPDPADSTLKDISWSLALDNAVVSVTTTTTSTTSTTTTTAAGTTTTTTTTV